MMKLIYYEDVIIDDKMLLGEHFADKAEILDFARKWDPQPFHVDEEAAKSYPYGGIIASSIYTFAVVTLLAASSEKARLAVIGILEYESVRMPKPVRPGDRLTVTRKIIKKWESASKPDRGLVRLRTEVRNQHNELVLRIIGIAMIRKRPV